MKRVLVTIPTYNEAPNIQRVIEGVEAVAKRAKRHSFRLLIIDDHSPDGTAKIARKIGKQYGNVHVLSGAKEGLGKAYIRGFLYALKHEEFEALITMDADMSHDPNDIPQLLKALGNADYVIGSRYVTGGTSGNLPLIRRINSRVANFVARRLVGIQEPVHDLTGGFKAIRRDALSQIALKDMRAKGYFFQVNLLHAFLSQGFSVKEVPITFVNRSLGDSKLKLKDIVEFVYSAYKLDPNAPVQKFVRFGLVGASGALVNLGVLSLLVHLTNIDTLLAAAIAIEVSIISNFTLNHRYTFKGYGFYSVKQTRESLRSLARKLATYNIGVLIGAAVSFLTFALLYQVVGMHYLPADILAIGAGMIWNYWVSTRYVWRAIDRIQQ
ncbi:MAG: glycosyltransferase family 2 protein [Candidatus Saccharimonadales bacterium]